jgi:hypothetical protein
MNITKPALPEDQDVPGWVKGQSSGRQGYMRVEDVRAIEAAHGITSTQGESRKCLDIQTAQAGETTMNNLKPCRSPYCECDIGKCTRPGFYDARGTSVQQEPDMRHPKIQALIGARARLEIELGLVEQLIEDPNCELTAMDMEYWNGLHDKLREKLLANPISSKSLPHNADLPEPQPIEPDIRDKNGYLNYFSAEAVFAAMITYARMVVETKQYAQTVFTEDDIYVLVGTACWPYDNADHSKNLLPIARKIAEVIDEPGLAASCDELMKVTQ